jgi:hypothetical protein
MVGRFVVDNNSDPAEAKQVLRQLRRTVRLGKIAERALKSLEERGSFDSRVVVLHREYGYYCAAVRKLSAYRPFSRDDVPGWPELTVVCGKKTIGSHGGSRFDQVSLWLLGTGFAPRRHIKPVDQWEQVTLRKGVPGARLGTCRMKANGEVTFVVSSSLEETTNCVIRISRNPGASAKSLAEAQRFARVVAACLVDVGRPHELELFKKCPQYLTDLRRAAPDWLIEDGHVHRMFNDILDAVAVVRVMEA